jgi:peptidoglycan/xylan/chitin deacetylase (PgdA/CDA1 family)
MAAPVILMYHSISPADDDPFDITVRPPRFEQQLGWLRRTGRTGTSVGQLLAARDRFDARRLVGLSFDDGYADFIEYALPLLQRYGFSATMFVPAGQLGKANDWDPEGPRKRLMTAPQLREIADAGIEIGSHGFRHRSLPDTPDAELAEEIETSRAMLRDITGQPVTGFCYPYGHLDARAVGAVQAAGYGYGCSVWPTEFAGPYALAREYMRQSDSPRSLWNRGLRHWLKHEYQGPGAAAVRSAGRAATQRSQQTPATLASSAGKDREGL